MDGWLSRQNMLIGNEATQRLKDARAAIIGLGGVGGASVEAIARCGVGNVFVMDYDIFEPSNINRQILALSSNVGTAKSDAAKARIGEINPDANITAVNGKFCLDTSDKLADFKPDYVIDAIDTVSAKIELIEFCRDNGVAVISCMGTGNRIDAHAFAIGDIEETPGCGCPLARVMRRELHKRGISGITVLYSKGLPLEPKDKGESPASISFVPPVAGYLMAGHVIREILELKNDQSISNG